MDTQGRINDLLELWRQSREDGHPLAMEELCRECPELLDAVRIRIEKVTRADAVRSHVAAESDGQCWIEGGVPVPGHDYRLEGKLGEGGFGEVWKARGSQGIQVAIKRVSLENSGGGLELESLGLMKQIRHPNLLAISGAWLLKRDGTRTDDAAIADWLIIAMELAECTLRDRFKSARENGEAGIPFEKLVEYMQDAAKALDYLATTQLTHFGKRGQGVQHGDVKPANLLLMGDSVKVSDFGLAQLLGNTVTRHRGGMSAAYAAPEIWEEQISKYSDQYSLAVTYCYLRAGKWPFHGSLSELKAGHLNKSPNLSMLRECERAPVARALSKDPLARWPTSSEFVRALAAAGRGVPLHSTGVNRSVAADRLTQWGVDKYVQETVMLSLNRSRDAAFDAMSVVVRNEHEGRVHLFTYALSNALDPTKLLFGIPFVLIPPGRAVRNGATITCRYHLYVTADLVTHDQWGQLMERRPPPSVQPDQAVTGLSIAEIEKDLEQASRRIGTLVRLLSWGTWDYALSLGLLDDRKQTQCFKVARPSGFCWNPRGSTTPKDVTTPFKPMPDAGFRLEFS